MRTLASSSAMQQSALWLELVITFYLSLLDLYSGPPFVGILQLEKANPNRQRARRYHRLIS
jgi:hypothetical protein